VHGEMVKDPEIWTGDRRGTVRERFGVRFRKSLTTLRLTTQGSEIDPTQVRHTLGFGYPR